MNTRRINTSMLNDPFFIGFDNMANKLSSAVQNQTNYPPYNIIKTDENSYTLELAVAGFKREDLEITLEDGSLKITGNQTQDEDSTYIHKGISTRNFVRTFTLMDTIVVNGADLNDGILNINLENVIPEEKKPRTIEINRTEPELLNG